MLVASKQNSTTQHPVYICSMELQAKKSRYLYTSTFKASLTLKLDIHFASFTIANPLQFIYTFSVFFAANQDEC